MAYNTQCTCAAKQLYWSIHFLFTDASLTVDSVAKVMEMVPADRVVEVWERLGVLNSLVERISRKLLTPKEKTRACVDLYMCTSTVPLVNLHGEILLSHYTALRSWLQLGKQNHSIIKLVSYYLCVEVKRDEYCQE